MELKGIIRQQFVHNTANNVFNIDSLLSCVDVDDIEVDVNRFKSLCKENCKNYNYKYSCPPYSPSFEMIKKDYEFLVAHALKIDMEPYKSIYNSVRMANSVAKSTQRKIFDKTFFGKDILNEIYLLDNGSCRLCKKCASIKKAPCRHPDKMHYSLESTGINVHTLTQKVFKLTLEWYKDGQYPNIQCVVSGVLTNNPEKIFELLYETVENIK